MEIGAQLLRTPWSLEEGFEIMQSMDVNKVDINVSDFFSPPEFEVEDYVDDEDAQGELQDLLDKYDLEITQLGATNNPLHPVEERADEADKELRDTIRLASQMGVDKIGCFSGLPGGHPDDVTPNFIIFPIPRSYQQECHTYQWEEVAIPYWQDVAEYADSYGVDLAIHIHLNTLVHHPVQLMELREATNDRIGAWLDPSHMWLQSIDTVETIRYLGESDALYHFEANDTVIYDKHARLKGLLDMADYSDKPNRSWSFCAVGYGHDEATWREFITTLRLIGYDRDIIVQHSVPEPKIAGLERGVRLLRRWAFEDEPSDESGEPQH